MKIKAIIQCRMSSKRFPGKVLSSFNGKPLLLNIVERLRKTKIKSSIVLATSDETIDDPLAIYAKRIGIDVIRGPLDDVVQRFILVLKKHKCDAFFRICGDSPLILPHLFDHAISIFNNNSIDLVTNVFPRSFPAGMSLELIKSKIFIENEKKILKKFDREHITRYFYNNFKKFKIFNIKCGCYNDLKLKLVIDRIRDLKKLESWYLSKGNDYWKFFPINDLK